MISSDPNIDREAFATACLLAARDVDTSPHYLVAVAVVESGLKNIPAPGSTGFGPFQILDGTWAQYMTDLGLTAEDRFDPFVQPLVAARIAVDGTAALVKILPDRRLPNARELYFTHLFGEHGASVILAGDRNRSIKDALLEIFTGANGPDRVEHILTVNKGVLTDAAGQPRTVSGVLEAVGNRLDPGFATAAELIKNVEPDLFSGPGKPAPTGKDSGNIPALIANGDLAATLRHAQATARAALPTFPHNGCAANLSALLQESGIPVPMTLGAGALARALEARGWQRIDVGSQEPGDVGVTLDNTGPPGPDHIYLVVHNVDNDEMRIADNQKDVPHNRCASGRRASDEDHGTTRTQHFLRAS